MLSAVNGRKRTYIPRATYFTVRNDEVTRIWSGQSLEIPLHAM